MSESGRVTTVKLTVIGKPDKVVGRGDIVFVGLTRLTVPSLPRDVPAPVASGRFLAIISRKQRAKVAAPLAADPADKIIAEGYPSIQEGFNGITVSVSSVTTTGIQAGKRAAQLQTAAAAQNGQG